MGLLDILKGAVKLAPMVAAPFTGGASLAASPMLNKVMEGASALGGTLGAIGDARGQGRAQEAAANLNRDQVGLQAQTSRQNALLQASQQKETGARDAAELDLKQKQFSLDAPSQKLANAIKGGAAARMQDVSANRPNGVPNISFGGGLRPSLIGSAGREAGSEMERQALQQMMNPEAMAALPGSNPEVLDQFQLSKEPQPNVLDKILNTAGTVGGISTGVLNAQDAIKKLLMEKRGPIPQMPQAQAGIQGALPGQQMGMPTPPQPSGLAANAAALLRNVRL